jgi:hypothetical protein
LLKLFATFRIASGLLVIAVVAFLFLGSLTPSEPDSRAAHVTTTPVRSSLVVAPIHPVSNDGPFYYVVASEEQAESVRLAETGAGEFYGSGRVARAPTIVVARSPEEFAGLTASFYAATGPGQAPPRIIDLRSQSGEPVNP